MIRASLLLLCLSLAACAPPGEVSDNRIQRFEAADYRGNWVVINYWAKWCKPCIEEIPELNTLAGTAEDVVVLGVNYDAERGDELEAQVAALGIRFPILLEDPGPALGQPMPRGLPTTLILDPDGEVVDTLEGPQTLESLLDALGRDHGADEAG